MHTDFALDLRVNRRKAGLSQRDVAHLLGVHPTKVSHIESGLALPSVSDIAHLSLMYGKSFEEFFHTFVMAAKESLKERIGTLPEGSRRWLGRFNRQYTLDALATRLLALDHGYEAA